MPSPPDNAPGGAETGAARFSTLPEAEDGLRKSERRFKMLSDASPLAVVETTTGDGEKITYMNPRFVQLFGYGREELSTAADFWQRAFPDPAYRQRVHAQWTQRKQRAIATGESIEPLEAVLTCRDGSRKNILWGFTSADGKNISFGLDLTERKLAEDKLRLASERLQVATRAAGIGIWDWDVANNELVWDDGMYRLYGMRRGDFSGAYEAWSKALHPDDKTRIEAGIQAALRGEREYGAEFRIIRPDGSVRILQADSQSFRDAQGATVRMVGVNYDITERKLAEEELRAQGQMLRTVIDHFPGMVFWKDRHSAYAGCNRTFALAAGLSEPAEIIGKTDRMLQRTVSQADRYVADDLHVMNQGRPKLGIIETRPQGDGRTAWFDTNKVPLRDDHGDVIGILGTSVDITARKRAEEELRQLNATLEQRIAERTAQLEVARKEAESANLAKSAFLANMSHEVRTPMNGILGLTELLRQTDLTGEQREWLETLKNSGEALLRLLNDVLDLSKVEAGRLVLEDAPFGLRHELGQAVNLMAARALQKRLTLDLRVDDAVPDALVGDAFRLRQILSNLLGNAIKFTEKGGITVTVVPEAGAPAGHVRLRISVADTGVGVAEDQLAKIFTPFTQADTSITRKFGGTGLGLSICARICELMHGHAFAENRPGGGSVFHVVCELTVDEAAPENPANPSPATPAAAGNIANAAPRSCHVLLVEDNLVNQKVAVALLSRRGHAVEVANHGEEALAALAFKPFDVVLMDVQMPVMDGLEATRRIRTREATDSLPHQRIVAMTASAMRGDRDICLAAGMDGYIAKPFQPDELYRSVEGIQEATPSEPPTPLEKGPPMPEQLPPAADLEQALAMMAGEHAILADAARTYLHERGTLTGNLKAAVADGDAARVRAAAHSLKSNLAMFHAKSAADAAYTLEQAGRAGILKDASQALASLLAQEERLARQLEGWLAGSGG